jgi:hypothetical protein
MGGLQPVTFPALSSSNSDHSSMPNMYMFTLDLPPLSQRFGLGELNNTTEGQSTFVISKLKLLKCQCEREQTHPQQSNDLYENKSSSVSFSIPVG